MLEKLKYLAYVLFTYLNLDGEVFTILMILMCMDSFVGSIKAMRLGDYFRFKILLWGVTMKLIFLMIPVTLALMAKNLGYDFTLAINVVMSILTVSEGISIISNIYMAKNKVKIRKVDIISDLLITIRKGMLKTVKTLIHKVEDSDELN